MLAILLALLVSPSPLPSASGYELPADFTRDGIVVPVTIDGRRLDFLLDSGASSTLIDQQVATQLHLVISTPQKASFGGDFSYSRTLVDAMTIGGETQRNVTVLTSPFERQMEERKIVGLLGGDFFAKHLVCVDFEHKKVIVTRPADAPEGPSWIGLSIDTSYRVPRVHARFNGVEGTFIVDLGAVDTMLYGHYFKQFHPNKPGVVMGSVVGVANQTVEYHQYTFSRFDFGNLAFADATVIVASGSKFEGLTYDGLIGRNILSNFNLAFDYAAGKLWVQPLVK